MADCGAGAAAPAAAPIVAAEKAPAGRKRKLNIFYQPMHERNIHNVKLLVSTVLPVTYPESLFKKFLTFPEEFCQLGT